MQKFNDLKFNLIIHSSGMPRKSRAHIAHRRYVALLDVLGMKEWLKKESPQKIADLFDEAMGWCELSSSGSVDGHSYGPIISSVHFSDSLLLWSPDDSWASFFTISGAVGMIVRTALEKGVPLRGSISVGEVVCNQTTQRFVGHPIADAHNWSEICRSRPYRSVGVDYTPTTIKILQEKSCSDPIPVYWNIDIPLPSHSDVIKDEKHELMSSLLIWYRKMLFVNHWNHGIFLNGSPQEMFKKRDLEVNSITDKKLSEMLDFYEAEKDTRKNYTNLHWHRLLDPVYEENYRAQRTGENSGVFSSHRAQARDYLILDDMRISRNTLDASQINC